MVAILLLEIIWDWFRSDIVKFVAKQFYKKLLNRMKNPYK